MASFQEDTVHLRRFNSCDLPRHKAWVAAIRAEQFMSRWFPRRFNGRVVCNSPFYDWFVVVHQGHSVGSVWIERERRQDSVVQLGIFLGRRDLFDKGIGRTAIELVISRVIRSKSFKIVRLNVRVGNYRAQSCYRACGFKVVGRGVKRNDRGERIEFITMAKEISDP